MRNRDLARGDIIPLDLRWGRLYCTFLDARDYGHDRCHAYDFEVPDHGTYTLYAEPNAPAGTNDIPHANWASD